MASNKRRFPNDCPTTSKKGVTKIKAAVNVANTTARLLHTGPKFKNQLLGKMVDYLKVRFLDLEDDPLPLDKILKEIDEENIDENLKTWIQAEGVQSSRRLQLTAMGEFFYSPPLPCRDRDSLLDLLKEYDYKGLGGIYLTDVESSIPNSERALKSLEKYITTITGPDKVQVLFLNDQSCEVKLSQFLKDMWLTTDNPDIELVVDKLKRNGETVMEQWTANPPAEEIAKKGKKKRELNALRDNKHVAHLLLEYDDDM